MMTTDTPLLNIAAHEREVYAVAFSPSGSVIASGSAFDNVKVWDAVNGNLLINLPPHEREVGRLTFFPDGNTLISADMHHIRFWDVDSGSLELEFYAHHSTIWGLALSPDLHQLASTGADSRLKIWNAQTGECLFTSKPLKRYSNSVDWSPDGARIAFASGSLVRIWDVSTLEEVQVCRQHRRDIQSIAWSPDGMLLGSGSEDKSVKLWNPRTGEETAQLKGHTDRIWCIDWAPDGRMLASAGLDGTIRLWDPVRHVELCCIRSQEEAPADVMTNPDVDSRMATWQRVFGLSFAPDGDRLASSAGDGTVKVWDVSGIGR